MLKFSDALLAALNGYKEDAMSRAEAIFLVTESLRHSCNECGMKYEQDQTAKSQELALDSTAWDS
ncbi:hypothetical protein JCM15765_02400 [Paradesulfitobacterium aromaticivorans]